MASSVDERRGTGYALRAVVQLVDGGSRPTSVGFVTIAGPTDYISHQYAPRT